MGFRNGSYCKVWSVESISDTHTKLKISNSKRNKNTEEWETDFSGFVSCYGTAVAKKAACLKEGDKIKLGEVDVSNFYSKKNEREYTTFKVFSFDLVEDNRDRDAQSTEPQPTVDDGEVNDERLPF